MKAREFDKKFDEGKEDITRHLNTSRARRPEQEQKRVNVDFSHLGNDDGSLSKCTRNQ